MSRLVVGPFVVRDRLWLTHSIHCCASDSIQRWNKVNAEPPKFIVIYRDGVGDGQLEFVYQHELPQIEAAIRDCGTDPNLMYGHKCLFSSSPFSALIFC